MMLTAVHLLLRLTGTSFQVYLSGKIGAEGIGLLQLTLSAGTFAMVAGIAGIRTSTMYLTAEELGRGRPENIPWVLSACIRYALVTGGSVALLMTIFAPRIAEDLIGNTKTVHALRLFAGSLCVNCLCGVMTGYFTAECRIGMLAAVEVAEQLLSMTVTVLCLIFWAGTDPIRASESVILGSSAGACVTLMCLVGLRIRERGPCGPQIEIRSRLTATAVPLALADILRSGITTLENMMVPRRLSLAQGISGPLASFGILTGMVFPVLMFPACILHALADLLIPEMAHCAAAEHHERIRHLVRKCLMLALLYGIFFSGGMFLVAEVLCQKLFNEPEAGTVLKRYAILVPMLYCDSIVDAMTKGLGQQRICVRYNIMTSALDIAGLYVLLPRYGMDGYFISFLITHLINFFLSLRRLLMITSLSLNWGTAIRTVLSGIVCTALCAYTATPWLRVSLFAVCLSCTLTVSGVLNTNDLTWSKDILNQKWQKKATVHT